MNLRVESKESSIVNSNNEISAYKDDLTLMGIKMNCAKILVAFSGVDQSFTILLTESLKRNKFTDERLTDAVNFVIDNCKYPKPSISDFIQFDKKVKLYTHNEVINILYSDFENYKAVEIEGKLLWAHLTEIKKYSLKRVNKSN